MDIYARQLAKAAYKGAKNAETELNNKFLVMTQDQYDNLPEVDPNVFYFITA